VAKICRGFGVKYLGVATLGEAIQIRYSGDKGRILGWLYDVHSDKVRQALTLSSTVAQLKYVQKGVGIGYDRKYITHHKEYIAIILIGYADLLPLIPHEKLSVTINGTKRKVLGLESMDQIVVQARKGDKLGGYSAYFWG
jgi:alanine racemase